MEQLSKSFTATRFFIAVIGVILIVIALRELQAIVLPFLVAYLLVLIFSPLNDMLLAKKVPNALLIPANLIIIIVIGFGLSRLLIESGVQLMEKFDSYTLTLNSLVQSTTSSLGIKDPELRSFNLKRILTRFDIKPYLGSAFNSVFSAVGAVALTLFFFIFIQSGHRGIMQAIRRSILRRKRNRLYAKLEGRKYAAGVTQETEPGVDELQAEIERKMDDTMREITIRIQQYIVSKVAMNSAAGIVSAIVLSLLGLDFPVLWGVLVFVLNFIPTIGSALAFIFISLFALLQTGSWSQLLLIGGIVITIQTIIFNLLEPLIIGKRIDLNPLVILLSVLLWGYLWGVVGMLIAVPLTAIIKIILSITENDTGKFVADLMDHED